MIDELHKSKHVTQVTCNKKNSTDLSKDIGKPSNVFKK